MAIIDDVIKIAKAEIGYHEKASDSQLDDKYANSGDENYTKYARDLDNVHYFNGNKQGAFWCTTFVAWCHWQALKKDVKKTKNELYHPQDSASNLGAGCVYAVDYYRNNNAWYKTPKVGDQIFFDWDLDGEADHTGIVIGVDSNYVYTIEGNTSGGQVDDKYYSLGYSCIAGYGRPNYSNTSSNTPTPTPTPSTTDRVLYKGCTGSDVKDMQTKLIACGYSCGSWGADGNFGNATEDALKKFQKAYKLEVDGCYGPESKKKLEEVYSKKKNPSKPTSKSYKVKVTHPNGLNLRTSAPKGAILTAMPQGTIISISKTENDWGYTSYNGICGWCCLEYTAKV